MAKGLYQDEELYLTQRGEIYYLNGTLDGKRIRQSCGTQDFEEAKLFLHRFKREHVEGWREAYDGIDRDWQTLAKMVHDRHKKSSDQRGIPFNLKPSDVFRMMRSTGFRCAVSGIPFAKRFADYGKRDPWAPSIDRIENRQGYTLDNCRVVCLAANLAMSDWGADVLLRLSRGVVGSSTMVSEEPVRNLNMKETEIFVSH